MKIHNYLKDTYGAFKSKEYTPPESLGEELLLDKKNTPVKLQRIALHNIIAVQGELEALGVEVKEQTKLFQSSHGSLIKRMK